LTKFIRIAIAALVMVGAAAAQTATGIIQGHVYDASGAAVPDAKMTVENTATGVKLTSTTNNTGFFSQAYLIPGEYKLTTEKTGFDKNVTSDIRVSLQQTIDLNISLKVGQVSTQVDVSANVAQLSTSTSSVATVISQKALVDLPYGRNPYSLATLVPGVIPGGGSTPWLGGGRNASSEITIDGGSVIVPENNVSIQDTGYQPIADTVAEVAVISNSLSAEFGRTGGGVIAVATKSGTNQIHGSLFEYMRNNVLNANSWGNNRNGAPRTVTQRNEFGGSIGGPVWLGKLYDGRNKTFFFFAEQSQRSRNAGSFTGTMPLAAYRAGDFSGLQSGETSNGQPAPRPVIIYDPLTVVSNGASPAVYTRSPFAGNIVPINRQDPLARNLLKYWPNPNAVPTNVYTQNGNFFSSGKSMARDDRFDSRIDHNFSDKWRLWTRGSYSNGPSFPFNGFGNIATSSGDGPNYSTNYNIALNSVHTINPSTVLNITYGFARKIAHRDPISAGVDLAAIGFAANQVQAAKEQAVEFPNISVGGNNGISGLGQATFTTLRIQAYSHDLRADITKIHGKHNIVFGAEARSLFMNFRQHGAPSGQFTFNNSWTQRQIGQNAAQNDGSGMASFLLGNLSGSSLEHTMAIASNSQYYGLYLRDDWKATRKLTLNIGLRWDVDLPRTERYNRLSYWDIDAVSPINGRVPGYNNLRGAMQFVGSSNRRQTPIDKNNWGPRFGFAYQMNEKTVFRGAYGILYSASVLQASGTSGSSGTQGFTNTTNAQLSENNANIVSTASLSNPFPSGFARPLGVAGGPSTNLGLGIGDSFFNDYVNPMIQEWSATLQRDFGSGFLIEAGYIANKGNHLIDGESNMTYNQLPASFFSLGNQLLSTNTVANPFYGIINTPTSTFLNQNVQYSQLLRPFPQYTAVNAFRKPQGNSIYHAFTLSVTKRYSNGLNFQGSYTNGKLIDDASQTVTFLGAAGSKQDFYCRACERSVSAQDVSQRLVMSFNYELPFGKGKQFAKSLPTALEYVLGNWQVNGIITFQTATPLQIGNGANNTNLGSPGQRPNNNGTSAKKEGPIADRLNSYFDQTVFSQAGNFTFGNTSRTSPDLRGPGTRAFDASIFKRIKIGESKNFEIRGEAFNAFNHPIWNGPGTAVNNSGSFGIITSKGGNPRTIQVALRLNF